MPAPSPRTPPAPGPPPGATSAARTVPAGETTRLIAGVLALAGLITLLLVLVRGESYWNLSDGVYAYTARAVLGGGTLYSEIAAAQPPLVYLTGSGILTISDSVIGLRLGLGVFQAGGAVLVALIIHRLTGSRAGAVLGAVATLLAPRTLHDFANLLPETIATPLLLGSVLAAARPRWSLPAGVLAALAILTKLPFALPALALFWFAADRRRFAAGGLAAGLGLAALFTLIYGFDFLRGTLLAQSGSGLVGGDLLRRELLQAAWNLLPLLPLAIVGFRLRSRAADPGLARAAAAGMFGSLAMFLTLVKHGTYINLAVAAEPFLVIFATAGTVWLLRERFSRYGLALAAVSWTFLLAQAASLMLAPGNPELFAQPFDRSNHGRIASSAEVRQGAKILRVNPCDRSRTYYSAPFMSFAARIKMPGNQGDPFILGVSDVYARQAALAAAEACP